MTPFEDIDGALFTAFGLVGDGVPSIAHAHTPDGSFVMLDGHLLEDVDPIERVLEGWLAHGVAAFEKHRFHGFFVAWNAESSECVLLRDQYGIVPGYFAEVDHGVVFSTDLRTLIRFGIDPTPDTESIDVFIASGYFPAPLTPLSSISKIPPGHVASITEAGMIETAPWYHHHTPEFVSEEQAAELMGNRLKESLQRAWPDDGNAGLLLSGGVDSAMILAGVTHMLDQPIRTFTFRYEDYQGRLNEGRNARAIAEHLGAPHEEIPIRPQDILDDLEGAVTAYDEPFTWGLHSYQLGPVADRGITSVFSGAGADGWSLAKRHRAAVKFGRLPGPIGSSIRAAVRAARPLNWKGQTKAEWVTRPVSGVGELYSPDGEWNRRLRRRLYRDPALAERGSRQLLRVYEDAAKEYETIDLERTLVLLDKRFNAAEQMLHWNRSWTLASGLDLILPYYDHDLLGLAMSIEGETTGKDLLRRIGAQYLTEEMAHAPKTPQQMPVSDWFRGPLSTSIRERLADLPTAMNTVFDPVGVVQLVDEHVQGRADHGWRLVGLLTIAVWFDQLSS